MTLNEVTRTVYAFFGVVYVVLGSGAMLLPTGWLPQGLADIVVSGDIPSPFGHILQEFGSVFIALGLVFFWFAKRNEHSGGFHWAISFYFFLNAFIHWIGPEGAVGSWSGGVINSIPFVVMALLGLLQRHSSMAVRNRGAD